LLKGKVGSDSLEVLEPFEESLFFDERLEKIALGLKVVVDRGVGDSGLAGDVANRCAGEAPLGKEA
jgi:hypothetical protein